MTEQSHITRKGAATESRLEGETIKSLEQQVQDETERRLKGMTIVGENTRYGTLYQEDWKDRHENLSIFRNRDYLEKEVREELDPQRSDYMGLRLTKARLASKVALDYLSGETVDSALAKYGGENRSKAAVEVKALTPEQYSNIPFCGYESAATKKHVDYVHGDLFVGETAARVATRKLSAETRALLWDPNVEQYRFVATTDIE